MRNKLLLAIFVVIVSPLLINALLYYLDPLGVVTYFHDLGALTMISEPHETGIRYLPGRYDFRGYTATIGHDGLRIVPDTMFSDCTIATVGDSLTFGMGVQDYETFTNLLAQTVNTAQWVNAGIPGYSALNVAEQIEAVAADGYLWLIVANDDEPFAHYFGGRVKPLSNAIATYLSWFMRPAEPEPDIERFDRGAQVILEQPNVLPFAFNGARLTDHIRINYPQVHIIPNYTAVVSQADRHPNAAGHQQIADALYPPVMAFVEGVCHAS